MFCFINKIPRLIMEYSWRSCICFYICLDYDTLLRGLFLTNDCYKSKIWPLFFSFDWGVWVLILQMINELSCEFSLEIVIFNFCLVKHIDATLIKSWLNKILWSHVWANQQGFFLYKIDSIYLCAPHVHYENRIRFKYFVGWNI